MGKSRQLVARNDEKISPHHEHPLCAFRCVESRASDFPAVEREWGHFVYHSYYVHPLPAIAHEPEMARNLVKAIEQIPLNMQRYKTLLPIQEVLLGYLNRLG